MSDQLAAVVVGDVVEKLVRCSATTRDGFRCLLGVPSGSGSDYCGIHRRHGVGGRGRKVATTVYLRRDQVEWLRRVADLAGIPSAELIRDGVDRLIADMAQSVESVERLEVSK